MKADMRLLTYLDLSKSVSTSDSNGIGNEGCRILAKGSWPELLTLSLSTWMLILVRESYRQTGTEWEKKDAFI